MFLKVEWKPGAFTKKFRYHLIDSDFICDSEVRYGGLTIESAAVVILEYTKRALPIGRNLALCCMYLEKSGRHTFPDYNCRTYMDVSMPQYLKEHYVNLYPQWDQIRIDRDYWFEIYQTFS